jgi:hypothetical protein
MSETISFRPTPAVVEELGKRTGLSAKLTASAVAHRDLGRYYNLLGVGLRLLALNSNEAAALVAAFIAVGIGQASEAYVWPAVYDALNQGIAEGFGVQMTGPGNLLDKTVRLTPVQAMAIVDAVEQLQVLGRTDEDALREVGLVGQGQSLVL